MFFFPFSEFKMASQSNEQEFVVKLAPRDAKKNFHIMKFHNALKVDPGTWTQVINYLVIIYLY